MRAQKIITIITVPDLPAVEYVELLERSMDFSFIDPAYREWDFHKADNGRVIPGRGKRFEVFVRKPRWHPNWETFSELVRNTFNELGMIGHVGAFLEWIRLHKPRGHFATIPPSTACYLYPITNDLCVPNFTIHGQKCCKLNFHCYQSRWQGQQYFVGFRPLD
ncbi:MAG: hypothetical protein ACOYUZ_05005 [Patescibacteria group bacterium]